MHAVNLFIYFLFGGIERDKIRTCLLHIALMSQLLLDTDIDCDPIHFQVHLHYWYAQSTIHTSSSWS